MRVAAVDIGTNSTRLLVAEVDRRQRLTELHRQSIVTRLGDGVDASGRLTDDAIQRVADPACYDRHEVLALCLDLLGGYLGKAASQHSAPCGEQTDSRALPADAGDARRRGCRMKRSRWFDPTR